MPNRINIRIGENCRDLFEGEPEFPVVPDLLEPFEVPVVVAAISGRRAPAGREQPNLVVVMQGPNGYSGEPGYLTPTE